MYNKEIAILRELEGQTLINCFYEVYHEDNVPINYLSQEIIEISLSINFHLLSNTIVQFAHNEGLTQRSYRGEFSISKLENDVFERCLLYLKENGRQYKKEHNWEKFIGKKIKKVQIIEKKWTEYWLDFSCEFPIICGIKLIFENDLPLYILDVNIISFIEEEKLYLLDDSFNEQITIILDEKVFCNHQKMPSSPFHQDIIKYVDI